MRKRLYILTLALIMIASLQQSVKAAATSLPNAKEYESINVNSEQAENEGNEAYIIKQVSLRDKLKRSPEAQINSFVKKYNKYSEDGNIEKLSDLYTDSYVNNDGFNKKTVLEMMKSSSDAYKNVKYDSQIESIEVSGDYAVLKIRETARGETTKEIEKLKGTGSIVSEIYYTDYLQKEKNQWKISATEISSEKVYLKYGEAKYMDVDITSPDCVPANSTYEVGIKTVLPGGAFVVGSIVNEEIVYPQQNKKDVYRSIKSDQLARLVKSNNNNHNEYATVSIAITRANVTPPAVMLDMTGIAFVMKRVNVISEKDFSKKNIDEKE